MFLSNYYIDNICNSMNKFSQIIKESRGNDSYSLLSNEIIQYVNKVNKKIPDNIKVIIRLTQKYNLLDKNSIEEIRNANKGILGRLSKKYNINNEELEDLWKLLKDVKNNVKLLPQYQTPQERQAIELGKLSMDDLTIDLDSAQGRNAAAKMYAPMLYKIVNQYIGKSKLSKQELMSAALLGFTNAMNDWKRDDNDGKKSIFKTYAAYRAQQQILNDINSLSHDLSGTSDYAVKKYGVEVLDAISIDGLPRDEDNEFKQDYLASMGVIDADANLTRDEKKQWDLLYKIIEDKFKQRDVDVFYRYFGLKGYKREKSKDIAKSLGMSEGNIRNSILNKMITFLKNDKKAIDILQNIQDVYTESLLAELIGLSKEQILETLINDDMFILLEELNRWNNRNVFYRAIANAVNGMSKEQVFILTDLLKANFEYLDNNFKKHKNLIILFLNHLYPTENIKRKSDVALIDYMVELQEYYKKYKL